MKLTPWMLTVAAFSIICLLAVTFFVKKLWAQELPPAPEEPAVRAFPMAITEIAPGTVITLKHIGKGPIGADVKLAPDTMTSLDAIVGRIAKEEIKPAVPLEGKMFYSVGDYPGLKIEDGKRGVTIDVDNATAAILSNMIKIGEYVDVHMTSDDIAAARLQSTSRSTVRRQTSMTRTLLKGVKVVAMNTGGAGSSGTPRNVTLELDEKQALYMLLAQEKGQISLTSNPDGAGPGGVIVDTETDRVTLDQLLGLIDEPSPTNPFKTEHYRAAGRTTSYWRDGELIEAPSGNDDPVDPSGQGTGGSGDDIEPNAAPAKTVQDVTQQQLPAVSGTL